MNQTPPVLDFTGERFTPECVREIWYEHWHRYAFARSLAEGRRVLDAACGEGYGSAMLAGAARAVLGLDISADAIAHAQARYAGAGNLTFRVADATRLDLPAASIDLVVSFETLEHVDAQDALLDGFARTLTDDGLLLISSPDKATYSDATGFRNEFHVRELYRDELLALLGRHFPHVRLYGQKLLFQSTIWDLQRGPCGRVQPVTATADGGPVECLDYAPLYFIALCSRQPLPEAVPVLSLFGDRDESVYRHYNHEIRKNIAAGGRIAELEAALARAGAERDALRAQATAAAHSEPRAVAWWQRLWRR